MLYLSLLRVEPRKRLFSYPPMSERLSATEYLRAEGFEPDDSGYPEREVLAAFERAAADLSYKSAEAITPEWEEKKNRGELPGYRQTLHDINVEVDAHARQQQSAERFVELSMENKAYIQSLRTLHDDLRQRLSHRGDAPDITAASRQLVDTWRAMGEAYDLYCKGLYTNEQLTAHLRAGHAILSELADNFE